MFLYPEFVNFRPIKLVVAKCWDPNPKGYFTIPRTEPVRPIDPGKNKCFTLTQT